jgi:D-serine deaminase-like pyridoxal phosphate-dependent protein
MVIEVDSGYRRTGVLAQDAGALARAAANQGLDVEGVFTFPGHAMAKQENSTPNRVREQAARDQDAALAAAASSLRRAGIEPKLISGGSTPTAGLWHAEASLNAQDSLDAEGSLDAEDSLNELRPGVYVFNDAMQLALGSCELADVALWAVGTVVSVPAADRFVLDTGSKVLGADANAWAGGFGLLPDFPGATVVQLSEHHAVVQLPQEMAAPGHGDRVAVIPNHVCAAVNLADELIVLSEGRHVDTWRVEARGANS